MFRRFVFATAGLVVGCGSTGVAPVTEAVVMAQGDVARVGSDVIPGRFVGEVAGARGVTPAAALAMLVDDALAAAGARARGLDRRIDLARLSTDIRARATVDHVRAEAVAAGPPTAAEIADMSAQRWTEVDLPEQRVVVHAVVLNPKDGADGGADDPAGRALAERVAAAVARATNEDDFKAAALAVPAGDRKVTAESLEAFVADGRIASPRGGGYDPAFVAGAFALRAVGDTSPPKRSTYGWHVIRLLEIRPPRFVPMDARVDLFRDAILLTRSRKAYSALLAALGARHPVSVDPAAAALLSELREPAP